MQNLMIVIALLGAALPSRPDTAHVPTSASDQQLESCLTKPSDTAGVEQVAVCYAAAVRRTDEALTQAETGLTKLAARRGLESHLAQGFASWHVYRDHWCDFEERFEGDPAARKSTALMCRYELGQSQLARIQNAN